MLSNIYASAVGSFDARPNGCRCGPSRGRRLGRAALLRVPGINRIRRLTRTNTRSVEQMVNVDGQDDIYNWSDDPAYDEEFAGLA